VQAFIVLDEFRKELCAVLDATEAVLPNAYPPDDSPLPVLPAAAAAAPAVAPAAVAVDEEETPAPVAL
jgi:hypothetical protein